jgi:MipA family protein
MTNKSLFKRRSSFMDRNFTQVFPQLLVCISLFSVSAAINAQSADTPWLPLWELGPSTIAVSQQAYPGSDTQVSRILPFPSFIYRGKYFRADRDTAGFRAVNTPNFEIDIGAAGSFGAKSDDISARKGMPNIGILAEFGPRLKWNLGQDSSGGRWRVDFPVRGVFDVNDSFGYRGVAFEPAIVYSRRINSHWSYSASAGAIFGDQKLASTFYGVDQQFAIVGRPAYEARSGLIATRLSATVSGQLSRDWRVFGFARLNSVSGAANEDSPLVKQATGTSIGLGVSYTLSRSSQSAAE